MLINRYFKLPLTISLLKVSMFLKATPIIGTHLLCFSFSSMLHPIVGAYNSSFTTIAIFSIPLCVKWLLVGFFSMAHFAYCVPGLLAALAWNRSVLATIIPIACMILFFLHPIGGHVMLYTLYWFIPIVISLMAAKHPFLCALRSTFIAHAVGSVIWIYTMPMAAEQWLALIPLVALERSTFALGATLLYYLIAYISIDSKQKNTLPHTSISHLG